MSFRMFKRRKCSNLAMALSVRIEALKDAVRDRAQSIAIGAEPAMVKPKRKP
jgi:hypothetical protein